MYIAESPLFEITCKDKTWFAYNEQEKVEILKRLEGKKYQLQRSKGLGENEPGDDVDDDDESRRPAGSSRSCPRTPPGQARCFEPAAGRQPGRAQGAYRAQTAISTWNWPIYPDGRLQHGKE